MIRLSLTQLSRRLPSLSIGTDAFRISHLNQIPSTFRFFHETKTQYQVLSSDGSPKRMRMIILGPPGSGKGTHCSKLLSTFNPSLIGTGDLLRWNVNNHTEVGKLAENYISRGDLLPDDVILELVKPELRQLANQDWILDGFPRTRAQALKLDKFLKEELNDELNLIIALHVPDDIILHRISGRWIHGPSGRVYNTTYNPPRVEGLDDVTGEPLIKRKDDTVEVFANRLSLFHEENEPMLNHYEYQTILNSPTSGEPSTTTMVKKLVHLSGHTSDDIWPQIYEHVQKRVSTI
ncbi:adenylate kinase-domain-containing protein [Melampsora americana]|nr:adenylate kinase-domain-containing protein [Melampsora americana]